jgi:hypothetical protein
MEGIKKHLVLNQTPQLPPADDVGSKTIAEIRIFMESSHRYYQNRPEY